MGVLSTMVPMQVFFMRAMSEEAIPFGLELWAVSRPVQGGSFSNRFVLLYG